MINFDMTTVVYVIFVFIFLKYGLKELNLIYMILISICIVYYVKNYMFKKVLDKDNLGSEVELYLKKIEKYDNNNLMKKIRLNYKNLNKYMSKKNRNMGDIYFLKDKILDYINSLNIEHNDKMIDSVYSSISKLIENKLK
tara:strand:- start:58 stop:477 length:420 start_codon:yes stop_codon:yes gene_type:complete